MNSLQTIFGSFGGVVSDRGLLEFFIAISFSVAIGIFCVFLYRLYFEEDELLEESVCKSFILIAPTVTSIFWTIQYSLPLSLGLLGALSFVRFRTPIKRSEDIAFILIVIASSLGSATYRFGMVSIFAGVLLAVVLAKKRLRLNNIIKKQKRVGIFVSFAKNLSDEAIGKKIEEIIRLKTGISPELKTSSFFEGYRTFHFQMSGYKNTEGIEAAVLEINKNLVPSRIEIFYNYV